MVTLSLYRRDSILSKQTQMRPDVLRIHYILYFAWTFNIYCLVILMVLPLCKNSTVEQEAQWLSARVLD